MKNIPLEMTIQKILYCTMFSVHSLLQYFVSVTFTKVLYMDMTIALKAFNEMQQTASICLNRIQHDIQLYTLLTLKCITI